MEGLCSSADKLVCLGGLSPLPVIPLFHPALIGQFVSDVAWGELDILLVDTPPGTSDEHLAVLENLRKHRVDGAVLVTTPQVQQWQHYFEVHVPLLCELQR